MLGQIFFIVCSHPWQASLPSFVLNKRKRQPLPPLQGENFFILVLRTRAGSQNAGSQNGRKSEQEKASLKSCIRASNKKESIKKRGFLPSLKHPEHMEILYIFILWCSGQTSNHFCNIKNFTEVFDKWNFLSSKIRFSSSTSHLYKMKI